MNRRFLAVLAATSIAVAALAALSIAYRVFEAEAAGRRSAASDFEILRYSLSRVRTASDLADPKLRARLAADYRASPNLLLIAVCERGAGVRWRMPAYSPYLPAADNVLPGPQVRHPALSTALFTALLPGDPRAMLVVDALYRTVDQGTVFLAFRDALLAMAIYIALVAVAIAAAAAVAATSSPNGEDLDSSLSRRMAAAAATPSSDGERVLGLDDSEDSTASHSAGSYAAAHEEEFDIPDMDSSAEPPDERTPDEQLPSGLFSPRSSLGWENYLDSRLDAELKRSESFGQDLSLLLLRLDGFDIEKSTEAEYRAVAETIVEFFTFRDLAFERGPDGFAVLLPDVDAEQALQMSENFVRKLDARLGTPDTEGAPIFLGLSSRTGRLVNSARMLEEAETALEKAKEAEGGSRIVAFRPDPEKYRRFLRTKGFA